MNSVAVRGLNWQAAYYTVCIYYFTSTAVGWENDFLELLQVVVSWENLNSQKLLIHYALRSFASEENCWPQVKIWYRF